MIFELARGIALGIAFQLVFAPSRNLPIQLNRNDLTIVQVQGQLTLMLHKSTERHPLSSPALKVRTVKKFSSLFLSPSYDKNMPRALIGSVMHLEPIILSLLPF